MAPTSSPVNVFWFRRDLRLEDNRALMAAFEAGLPVVPIFIFDTTILGKLDNKKDARVEFIHQQLERLQAEAQKYGSAIRVYHGTPLEVWLLILQEFAVHTVFAGQDYEPPAVARDVAIDKMLHAHGTHLELIKDQVIFEKSEVRKDTGGPYTVFTPYARKWRALLDRKNDLKAAPSEQSLKRLQRLKPRPMPSLQALGFEPSGFVFPPKVVKKSLISHYERERNFPGKPGTTRLGMHLRFGTVSVRGLMKMALPLSPVWTGELIWREFFMMLLWHFPHTQTQAYRRPFDRIEWRNDKKEFKRWCDGQTGYPIVDAGMRQLNQTGFMHNRVRMITGSFLTKHLLIDWRWGEEYFARRLLDYEMSSNVGNWQWVAGCGCDAAPYFRVFNPEIQTKKFDPKGIYLDRWVPERQDPSYPAPMVEHAAARARCLEVFKKAVKS